MRKTFLKKSTCSPSHSGFTMIELIFYIAILAIMLGAIVPFAWSMINSSEKGSVQQEVNANVRYLSERIKYEIRNASGINSVAATSISLATTTPATNPTVIDLSGGNIRITQGVSAAVALNSANTTITGLTFTNYTSGDNKTKHIQFVFTVSALYGTSNRQEYLTSTNVEGSAELRSN